MRRLAVLALGGAALMPVAVLAQSPSPPAVEQQTLCVRVVGPPITGVIQLIELLEEGSARMIAVVPCEPPFIPDPEALPTPSPTARPTPAPTPGREAWTRKGSYRYRWDPPDDPEGYLFEDRFVLRVIPDRTCARGLRVTVRDEYGDDHEVRRNGRAPARRTTRVAFDNDFDWDPDTVRVAAIRCVVPASSFGDGTWRVGTDIRPGTYRARGTSSGDRSCYWERLRGFSGSTRDIIANDFIPRAGPVVVRILGSDRGFMTRSCGTWRRIG